MVLIITCGQINSSITFYIRDSKIIIIHHYIHVCNQLQNITEGQQSSFNFISSKHGFGAEVKVHALSSHLPPLCNSTSMTFPERNRPFTT